MAEIINFNKKRKAKNRIVKENNASANRIKFGRTKIEKQLEHLERTRYERHLDSHKLEINE